MLDYHRAVHALLVHHMVCPDHAATGKMICCRAGMDNWQELIAQHDEYATSLPPEPPSGGSEDHHE